MLTALAVVLVGVYLILTSQSHVSSTGTLIWGIVVAALALFDLVGGLPARRAPP
jgi:lipopolysaccharide export LptBFGC system permease protein LptF